MHTTEVSSIPCSSSLTTSFQHVVVMMTLSVLVGWWLALYRAGRQCWTSDLLACLLLCMCSLRCSDCACRSINGENYYRLPYPLHNFPKYPRRPASRQAYECVCDKAPILQTLKHASSPIEFSGRTRVHKCYLPAGMTCDRACRHTSMLEVCWVHGPKP